MAHAGGGVRGENGREYGRPLIVPMTLWNQAYRDEIFELIGKAGCDLLHVFLDLTEAELRRRIDAQILVDDNPEQDARARAFRHEYAERCLAARHSVPPGTLVLRSDEHTPAGLADQVLAAAGRASLAS